MLPHLLGVFLVGILGIFALGANQLNWADLDSFWSSTTVDYIKDKIWETFFRPNLFLEAIRSEGGVREDRIGDSEAAGLGIAIPIAVNKNPTTGWRSVNAAVDLTVADPLRTALFPWSEYSGSVTWYRRDFKVNQGQQHLLNLLQARVDQALDTIKLDVELAIAQGNGVADNALKMAGLRDAVNDPTNGWTLAGTGGISNASLAPYPNAGYGGLVPPVGSANTPAVTTDLAGWHSQVLLSNGLDQLVPDMIHLHNTMKADGKAPKVIWFDQKLFELYEQSMLGNIRYNNLDTGDTSFDGLDFKGTHVNFDPNLTPMTTVPTGWSGTADPASSHRGYFLNPEDWELVNVPGWGLDNPIEDEVRQPNNQQIATRLITIMQQLICKSRRSQGLLFGVPEN
jgi:hypothetical protein